MISQKRYILRRAMREAMVEYDRTDRTWMEKYYTLSNMELFSIIRQAEPECTNVMTSTDDYKERIDMILFIINERIKHSANEDLSKFEWDDDSMFDFVNWHLNLFHLRHYELENQEIIDSFKRGDDYKDWHEAQYKNLPKPPTEEDLKKTVLSRSSIRTFLGLFGEYMDNGMNREDAINKILSILPE